MKKGRGMSKQAPVSCPSLFTMPFVVSSGKKGEKEKKTICFSWWGYQKQIVLSTTLSELK